MISIELRIRDVTIPIRYWGIDIDLGSKPLPILEAPSIRSPPILEAPSERSNMKDVLEAHGLVLSPKFRIFFKINQFSSEHVSNQKNKQLKLTHFWKK